MQGSSEPHISIKISPLLNKCHLTIPVIPVLTIIAVSEGPGPVDIVVQCRGRIFVMKVVDDSEKPLTAPELQAQFQYIRDKCDQEPEGPGIGALTGDNRTTWAQVPCGFQA